MSTPRDVVLGLTVAAVVMSGWPAAFAQAPALFDPQAVAINVHRTPVQPWPGYGIYLTDGLVITAAHVAGQGLLTHPKVVFEGQELPTSVVKEGSYPDNDLTVLKIDAPVPPKLAALHTRVCTVAPHPGELVLVATPEALTKSEIIKPEVLPPNMRDKYAASIKDVYTTGNSGSGVFDADQRCLLGIMSSKIESDLRLIVNGEHVVRKIGLAKHFVPAKDIQDFVGGIPKG